jgi:hypothetical protein
MPQDWFAQFESAPKENDWFAQFAAPPAPPAPTGLRVQQDDGIADTAVDVARGVAKGINQGAVGFGRLVHLFPGLSRLTDAVHGIPGLSANAFNAADEYLEPSNTAERVGKVGEQITEVMIPGRAITAAGTKLAAKVAPKLAPIVGQTTARVAPRVAVEGVANAGMSAVQGGDPTVAGVIGGVMPIGGAVVSKVAPALRASAEKQVSQALGATKERFKAMAERLTPEILRRGLRGSREQLQTQAAETASEVGQQIDEAIEQYGARQVSAQPVIDALETAKNAFQIQRTIPIATAIREGYVEVLAGGRTVFRKGATMAPDGSVVATVAIEPRAIRQLTGLQKILTELGEAPRVDQLIAVRRAWDAVVDQAGGYAHRAPGALGMPLKDQSEAAAKRQGANAIRALLDAEVPELSVINKEYHFWKSLDDVLSQTLKRTQPQAPSLTGVIQEAGGRAVGATTGGVGTAFAVGKLAKWATSVFTSPRWRLASAQAKDKLAEAIMSGNLTQIAEQLSRITATQGSKVGVPAGAQ